MIDSFVTQCPHCRTRFRVTQDQLAAAHGAVRCGACLHVFNAPQHLLDKPPATPDAVTAPPPAAEGTAPVRKAPLDSVWIHDDLDLDSLDLDEELARLEQEEQQSGPVVPVEPATAAAVPADERWAEQLLEESQPPLSATDNAPPTGQEEPVQAMKPAVAEFDDSLSSRVEPDLGDAGQVEDEDEDEDDAQAETAVEPPASAGNLEPEPEPEPEHESEPARTSGRGPDESLLALSDDPLQLQWQAPPRPWGRWIGWGLLNLLAAGALLAQYTSYHFEELARQDRYRPWFEMACPQLGCNLPPKVDVSLIKSSNLVVRSHPDFAGALVVDAILYNRASFAQPFPLLELRFSDINDKLLANRRFKPSEYLAGELAGQVEMPPQTPIHISLDILDPGQEAVNYSLTFQSPE
jgi:predicted Zn finger-like uncharacterized protein